MNSLNKLKAYKLKEKIIYGLEEWAIHIREPVPSHHIIEHLSDIRNIKGDGKRVYIKLDSLPEPFHFWKQWFIIDKHNDLAQPNDTNKLIIDYLKLHYEFNK